MLFRFRQAALAAILVFAALNSWAQQTYYPVQELLTTGKTVVGEDIRYPAGKPRVSVAIVTIPPGATAAFHRHPAPLIAYVLEGELNVDYGDKGIKTFRQGEAMVEAMDVSHRGINPGTAIVKLLAVYVGAEGTPNVLLERQ